MVVRPASAHRSGGCPPEPGIDDDRSEFESYRALLFAIAYRMLGSVMEAEDVVQDAYLRYRTAAPTGLRSLKAFLSTVVTRLCLDRLKSARAQREQYVGPWLPEPLLTTGEHSRQAPGAGIELRESVSMALLVLLESLTPVERAVFLLREVFELDYDEIATMVDHRQDACRQLFARARQRIAERRPRFQSSPEARQRLTNGFMQAAMAGDLDGLTSLLAEDITLWSDGGGKFAAARRPIHGASAVGRGLLGFARKWPRGLTFSQAEVNGSPAFIVWRDDAPFTVAVLELDERRVREIRVIANPDKLRHLGRAPVDAMRVS